MDYRTPLEDRHSDFNQAVSVCRPTVNPKEVKHMWACKFGENDGPHWVWILELLDGSFGYLKAGCDYTGWNCLAGGEYIGGFKSAHEATDAVPIELYDGFSERDRKQLHEQIDGLRPYALAD